MAYPFYNQRYVHTTLVSFALACYCHIYITDLRVDNRPVHRLNYMHYLRNIPLRKYRYENWLTIKPLRIILLVVLESFGEKYIF
jgi:hypothetical protein